MFFLLDTNDWDECHVLSQKYSLIFSHHMEHYHLKTKNNHKSYLMSVVSNTGRGCRFGWSELGGVEAALLLNCSLPSIGNLCLFRPRCWIDGERSVSTANEDKSENEQLENFTATYCSIHPDQAMVKQ